MNTITCLCLILAVGALNAAILNENIDSQAIVNAKVKDVVDAEAEVRAKLNLKVECKECYKLTLALRSCADLALKEAVANLQGRAVASLDKGKDCNLIQVIANGKLIADVDAFFSRLDFADFISRTDLSGKTEDAASLVLNLVIQLGLPSVHAQGTIVVFDKNDLNNVELLPALTKLAAVNSGVIAVFVGATLDQQKAYGAVLAHAVFVKNLEELASLDVDLLLNLCPKNPECPEGTKKDGKNCIPNNQCPEGTEADSENADLCVAKKMCSVPNMKVIVHRDSNMGKNTLNAIKAEIKIFTEILGLAESEAAGNVVHFYGGKEQIQIDASSVMNTDLMNSVKTVSAHTALNVNAFVKIILDERAAKKTKEYQPVVIVLTGNVVVDQIALAEAKQLASLKVDVFLLVLTKVDLSQAELDVYLKLVTRKEYLIVVKNVDELSSAFRRVAKIACEKQGAGSGSCPKGFQYDASVGSCEDKNECAESNPPCKNGKCLNTRGSFFCECKFPYMIDSNTRNKCTAVKECARHREIMSVFFTGLSRHSLRLILNVLLQLSAVAKIQGGSGDVEVTAISNVKAEAVALAEANNRINSLLVDLKALVHADIPAVNFFGQLLLSVPALLQVLGKIAIRAHANLTVALYVSANLFINEAILKVLREIVGKGTVVLYFMVGHAQKQIFSSLVSAGVQVYTYSDVEGIVRSKTIIYAKACAQLVADVKVQG